MLNWQYFIKIQNCIKWKKISKLKTQELKIILIFFFKQEKSKISFMKSCLNNNKKRNSNLRKIKKIYWQLTVLCKKLLVPFNRK